MPSGLFLWRVLSIVQDSLEDPLGIGQNIIVPETNNAKTFFFEKAYGLRLLQSAPHAVRHQLR